VLNIAGSRYTRFLSVTTSLEFVMKIRSTWMLLACSVMLLGACGQKGPLYLPKQTPPADAAAIEDDGGLPEKVQQDDTTVTPIGN
jgi:predicted small lipoprotein YifL